MTPDIDEVRHNAVMRELGEIKNKVDIVNGRVRKNEIDIAGIKGRASTAGMVSGAISGIVAGLAAAFGLSK
jgi:hypothetical protein